MRSYKRYTRRKRLLKHIVVVALVFILGLVLLRAVSYIAILLLGGICHRKRIVSGGIYRVTEVKIIKN